MINDSLKMIDEEIYNAIEKEVKVKMKSTGRNQKPSSIKKLVKTELKGMEETSLKTIRVSVDIVDRSIEFYNEIFDEDE